MKEKVHRTHCHEKQQHAWLAGKYCKALISVFSPSFPHQIPSHGRWIPHPSEAKSTKGESPVPDQTQAAGTLQKSWASHTRAEFALSQETGTCKELQEPWAGAAGTLSWSFRYHLWRTSNCQESFCQLLMILCVKILRGIHRDSPQALLYISYFLFDGQRHSISPSPKQIMAYRNTLRRCWWQHGHSPLQTNSHETDLFSAAHWAERVVGSTFPITPTWWQIRWGLEDEVVKGWPDFVLVFGGWSHSDGFLFLGTLPDAMLSVFHSQSLILHYYRHNFPHSMGKK